MKWRSGVTLLVSAAFSGLLAGAGGVMSGCAAQGQPPSSGGNTASATTQAGMRVSAQASERHFCEAQNSCKGKGGCHTGDNGCRGKNSCKGKGGCFTLLG